MDLATIMSVAQTLFAALQCSELRDLCSFLGYKSELNYLENTVETVKAVLLDAESKDDVELSHQARLYIEQLKDAVYDADDLFDEFVTLAKRKHNKLTTEEGAVKARRYLSRITELPFAYRMSQGVKGIRKKLDAIADNHNKFGFKLDSQSMRKRREETCSYVYAQDIIGRDGDKEKIVGMLLNANNVKHDVSFLTIVGMGGLGKTTLVQLIYNDERVIKEFPTRLWACVGDVDPNHLNVKAVLAKILESITKEKHKHDELTLDLLQLKVREKLAQQKYLLVLDDVWNENRNDWLVLENFLMGAPRGSWVVVTTRSSSTAEIVENGSLYELEGLSDEDSWNLFERAAFGQREGEKNPPHLVKIGKKIVEKCANVPLAIKVAGSLLYGQGEDKWLSFEMNGLAQVSPNKNDILPILKFSYYHLESPLKSCFSYCALFPKDYEIDKEMLISLWMAQGYIVPLEKGQSTESAGEEYFSILLSRCFFQDVEKDENGEIVSVVLHDLMHDVAQHVSRKDVCSVHCVTGDLDNKIRHISVTEHTGATGFSTKNMVRILIFLCWQKEKLCVATLLDNWLSLRALDLSYSGISSLPDQISKLVHLRFLDLSFNDKMEVLPKSFTKLYNLETLMLNNCTSLRELPNDFCNLVNLRCLEMMGCDEMTHMPAGMGKLRFHKLNAFAVDLYKPGCGNVLEGLHFLTKIKGHLEIKIKGSKNDAYEKGYSSEGGYLMNKQHLNGIKFMLSGGCRGVNNHVEELMEDMQPHANIRKLSIWSYKYEKLPSWARGDNLATSLPNLVEIDLHDCAELESIPALGELRYLRYLKLTSLLNLEYMEENRNTRDKGEESISFRSLELLELWSLPSLRGWWKEAEERVEDYEDDDDDEDSGSRRRRPQVSPLFPHLSSVGIQWCGKLTLTLMVPNVERVELIMVNKRLRVRGTGMDANGGLEKLREVTTDNLRCLKSMLPINALQSLTKLKIQYDDKLEKLEEVGELLRCLPSLRSLVIWNCSNMKTVGTRGLEHLTALEKLEICYCPKITLTQELDGEAGGLPLPQSLLFLRLDCLPNLVNLPQFMQHLPSLQSLHISYCKALESLPEWMPRLTSLTHLTITVCSDKLKRRCNRSPPGQDWPNIRHIPNISITKEWQI